jgi:aspartate dehydrogenase
MEINRSSSKLRVGILGFGALGQHIYETIRSDPSVSARMEVLYVWNRSSTAALEALGSEVAMSSMQSLEEVPSLGADIVVEVSHPSISVMLAAKVMAAGSNFCCGSPTALADTALETSLREAASKDGNGALYIPVGALWGASDLQALANRGECFTSYHSWASFSYLSDGCILTVPTRTCHNLPTPTPAGNLQSVTITMKKHPAMIKLTDAALLETCAQMTKEHEEGGEGRELLLYEGSVRGLCPIAPNNVNTMACTALAAHTLGFDGVTGRLVADARLTTHEIVLEAKGQPNPTTGQQFELSLQRSSPAPLGAVTSKATYGSFVESLLKSSGRGQGVHFV